MTEDLVIGLRKRRDQGSKMAAARIEADAATIARLEVERDVALAANRGLVRLNEMTEARAQRFEAALEEIASHDTGATAGIAHTAILALIPTKGAAEPTEYERKVAQMKKDFPNGI